MRLCYRKYSVGETELSEWVSPLAATYSVKGGNLAAWRDG